MDIQDRLPPSPSPDLPSSQFGQLIGIDVICSLRPALASLNLSLNPQLLQLDLVILAYLRFVGVPISYARLFAYLSPSSSSNNSTYPRSLKRLIRHDLIYKKLTPGRHKIYSLTGHGRVLLIKYNDIIMSQAIKP